MANKSCNAKQFRDLIQDRRRVNQYHLPGQPMTHSGLTLLELLKEFGFWLVVLK